VTRVRRRTVRERRGLPRREAQYLRCGNLIGGDQEEPDSFVYRDEDGVWTVDKLAARQVWDAHHAELIAEAAQRGLIHGRRESSTACPAM
jgi:hypothetical protein